MVVVVADVHKRTHTFVAVDEVGRKLGQLQVEAPTAGHAKALAWTRRAFGHGLALVPTPHRFELAGQTLYTWCALDTLIFPTILGLPAQVQSPCHTTGAPVRLSLDATGVAGLEPQAAVVSLVDPADLTSIRSAFGNEVHFFASPETAQPWLQEHPGAAVLPIARAHQLARPLAQSLLVARAPKGCC